MILDFTSTSTPTNFHVFCLSSSLHLRQSPSVQLQHVGELHDLEGGLQEDANDIDE